jgi:hypothetical protein
VNTDSSLDEIKRKVDIIHASALFHLLRCDDQVKIGIRFVELFKPDANAPVVGRQIANFEPLDPVEHVNQGHGWYRHNMRTWQQLWDVVGGKTGTQWKATGVLSATKGSTPSVPGLKARIKFAVYKVN